MNFKNHRWLLSKESVYSSRTTVFIGPLFNNPFGPQSANVARLILRNSILAQPCPPCWVAWGEEKGFWKKRKRQRREKNCFAKTSSWVLIFSDSPVRVTSSRYELFENGKPRSSFVNQNATENLLRTQNANESFNNQDVKYSSIKV